MIYTEARLETQRQALSDLAESLLGPEAGLPFNEPEEGRLIGSKSRLE